jgi:hypothetical protein
MSWNMKRPPRQPEEPDPLVAQLHPLVFTVQNRLREQGRPRAAIDVLRECLKCLEAASSHAFGFGWPTTDTTEYYGHGPDPANVDVVQQLVSLLYEGVPPEQFTRAAAMLQHGPTGGKGDPAVKAVGARARAVTTAFLKCLDLPDALS